MTKTMRWVALLVLLTPGVAFAQADIPLSDEVPLRVEAGRLVVRVVTGSGVEADFVLGAARSHLSESGAEILGGDLGGARLGRMPVDLEDASVVPDDELFLDGGGSSADVVGVLGGQSLVRYDVLIDVPGERLVLKRPGRSVTWEGVELTSAVPLQILHGFLIRTEVEVNGEIFSAHVDLSTATMLVSSVVRDRAGVADGSADFRMGYAAFPARPARYSDHPLWSGGVGTISGSCSSGRRSPTSARSPSAGAMPK